jgi:hypothetical protein
MKKQLLASAAMLLGAVGFATPSVADVDVTGTWTKTLDITVVERITKVKIVTITVNSGVLEGLTGAQALAVHNQRIQNNSLDWRNTDALTASDPFNQSKVPGLATAPLGGAPPANLPAHINAIIRNGSFSENIGVVMWNQDVGNNVNQANALTVAVVQNAAFAEATNGNAQYIVGNTAVVIGFFPFGTRAASIQGSVNDNIGVVMLNQNAGYASNQYNSTTLAIGLQGAAVAMADADLGQWNQRNTSIDLSTVRLGTIAGSINGNTGITLVNQNTGNYNNQATMISFSGSTQ